MRQYYRRRLCDLELNVKGQIMYFLVNASPPKPSDVALQTLQMHRTHMLKCYWALYQGQV